MADSMYSLSSDWNRQEITVLFHDEHDDGEEPTKGITLSRQEAMFVGATMLEYAQKLLLSEDEYWGEEE